MVSGIYAIQNVSTNQMYVGSSAAIAKRWTHHQGMLRNGKHPNRHLQSAHRKYGADSFNYVVLEHAQEADLIVAEQAWMDMAQAEGNELYNMTLCAEPRRGYVATPQERKKISESLKLKRIVPPSRIGVGYGFCKLYCPAKHYKTSRSLIHGSNACKECQRLKSQAWRAAH